MLAVIAARMRTASSPSRKTIIPELKTTVPWLTFAEEVVGSKVCISITRAERWLLAEGEGFEPSLRL